MKNILLIAILIAVTHTSIIGQNNASGKLIVFGHVKNAKNDLWKFHKTGFLGDKLIEVKINDDGKFSRSISIDGLQDLILYLNDETIAIYAMPNDSVGLYWDENNFEETFRIISNDPLRSKELNLNMDMHWKFKDQRAMLDNNLNGEENASEKFKLINEQYNAELKFILDTNIISGMTEKFIVDIYYKHMYLLERNKILNYSPLAANIEVLNPANLNSIQDFIPSSNKHKSLKYSDFLLSPIFRDFLFDRVRFSSILFNSNDARMLPDSIQISTNTYISNHISFSQSKYYVKMLGMPWGGNSEFAWRDYYSGLSQFKIIPIRDWFVTKSIFYSFHRYDVDASISIIEDFLGKCETKVYTDTLKSFYKYIVEYKPGTQAPNFELKDVDGNLITLDHFRGKVIYLDFWGVSCGPCRYAIKNDIPSLHEKFKNEDVVFINICIDSNEDKWKETINKLEFKGINLFAEGGRKNRVCIDYQITGIPHYTIIDRKGNFTKYNAERPRELLKPNNTIDRVLNKRE